MANEINSNAPTHDRMNYEVRSPATEEHPQGQVVGEAASGHTAAHLHAVAKEVYGDGSTVNQK